MSFIAFMASSNQDWFGSQVRGSGCGCWGWAWIPCTNSRARARPCTARLPCGAVQPVHTTAGGLPRRRLLSVSTVRPRLRGTVQTVLRSAATAGRRSSADGQRWRWTNCHREHLGRTPPRGMAAPLVEAASGGASDLRERCDLLIMLKEEIGGPLLRVKVETDCCQPPTSVMNAVRPPRPRIRSDQPQHRLGDLVDERIFRDPTQEPRPLQTVQLCLRLRGRLCQSQPLRLFNRAVTSEASQSSQKSFCSVIDKCHALRKPNRHPCPHSDIAVMVDQIHRG